MQRLRPPQHVATTEQQLHDLHNSVNNARHGSTTIKVDKTALFNLLRDHYALCGALARRGDTIQTPES